MDHDQLVARREFTVKTDRPRPVTRQEFTVKGVALAALVREGNPGSLGDRLSCLERDLEKDHEDLLWV